MSRSNTTTIRVTKRTLNQVLRFKEKNGLTSKADALDALLEEREKEGIYKLIRAGNKKEFERILMQAGIKLVTGNRA